MIKFILEMRIIWCLILKKFPLAHHSIDVIPKVQCNIVNWFIHPQVRHNLNFHSTAALLFHYAVTNDTVYSPLISLAVTMKKFVLAFEVTFHLPCINKVFFYILVVQPIAQKTTTFHAAEKIEFQEISDSSAKLEPLEVSSFYQLSTFKNVTSIAAIELGKWVNVSLTDWWF